MFVYFGFMVCHVNVVVLHPEYDLSDCWCSYWNLFTRILAGIFDRFVYLLIGVSV